MPDKSAEEANKKLEEITRTEPLEKTIEQLKNLVELRDYQRKNPLKGFIKQIYYSWIDKI
ncbi:MAG: hypothetical protein PHH54_00450 [Candidatus Nanoarchaeia archaeon]|nr:hypothetical protein [Candidatus Nanoarchaeia archaeon]MDD5740433.1 hypothetical protein [Candidatus Nanoarchaeia archaeon]